MYRSLPLVFSLLLAAPARADGVPPDGMGRPHSRVHDVRPPVYRHRIAVRHAVAQPMGPAYDAWPEPAEVRVPIYNRPGAMPVFR